MTARTAFAFALLALSTTAQSYTLSQFNQHASVQAPAGAAVARFALNEAAMRASQHAQYADIGMFNGAGDAVPFSIIQAETGGALGGKNQLALIPITLQREGAKKNNLRDTVMAEIKLDGITIERVRGEAALQATFSAQVGKNIVIDNNPRVWHYAVLGEPEPVAYVTLDVAESVKDFAVALRIEGSDDLTKWALMAEGTIHRAQVGSSARQSLRLSADGQRSRFVRVSALGEGALPRAALQGVLVEHPLSAIASPETVAINAPLRAGGSAGEWVADFGGRFPLFGLNVALPQSGLVANMQWSTRVAATEPWKPLANELIYRTLHPNKVEIRSPELALANLAVREVRVQSDELAAARAGLTLTARYHPIEVLFAVRGAGPFTLGVGLATSEIVPQALPLSSFSTTWSQQSRTQIALASAEPLRANANVTAATAPFTWRTPAIWAGGGLAALLTALALVRGLRSRTTKPTTRVGR